MSQDPACARRRSDCMTNRDWEEMRMQENAKKTVRSGITFGSALAMVISYNMWHSVGWAIFHGLLSWVYVIYFLLNYHY